MTSNAIPELPPRYAAALPPAEFSSERERLVLSKVERAKEHVGHINTLWRDFTASNALEVVREEDLATGGFVDRLRVHAAPPLEQLALVFGDALHNLRSALDHLTWQLIESNGGSPGTGTYFPIFKSKGAYDAGVQQKVSGVEPKARCALDLLRPYQGGCEPLWTLHQLDIQDKHRLILVALMNQQAVGLDMGKHFAAQFPDLGDIPSLLIYVRPEDRAVYDGTELFRASDSSSGNFAPRYQIAPELGPGQPGAGMTVSDLLYQSLYVTQRVIRIFGRFLHD